MHMISRRYRFELWLGLALAGACAAVWLWQFPGALRGRLTHADVGRYIAAIDAQVPMDADEKAASLARLRAWAEADDGRPVYMLNLMRYYPQLHPIRGAPPFAGTPAEANRRYERATMPLLLKVGGVPQFSGVPQGRNVLDSPAAVDDWTRVLLVRYPSRRAFLELVSDPAYAPAAPLKLMASQVFLVPLSPEVLVPELRWLVAGVLLVAYLAIGWHRAVTRRTFR
jgi:hypothetical protein